MQQERMHFMNTEEKQIIQSITQAVVTLPDDKREFILGYAEGVIAMAGRSGENRSSA